MRDFVKNYDNDLEKTIEVANKNRKIENDLSEKRRTIMEILGIPLHTQYSVLTKDLCNIFLDDKKCEEFISKLKNKAFW